MYVINFKDFFFQKKKKRNSYYIVSAWFSLFEVIWNPDKYVMSFTDLDLKVKINVQ